MTERLPYEEQLVDLLDSLPLPDTDMAWADMKRRLEENEDSPLLPFWLRGCAGWALLGIVLLVSGWFVARSGKWFNKKHGTVETNEVDQQQQVIKQKTNTVNYSDDSVTTSSVKDSVDKHKDSTRLIMNDFPNDNDSVEINSSGGRRNKIIKGKKEKDDIGYSKVTKSKISKGKKTVPAIPNDPEKVTNRNKPGKSENDSGKVVVKTKPVVVDPIIPVKTIKTEPVGDSVKAVTTVRDSATKEKEVATKPIAKKDSTKKKTYSFGAGIAMHQQIPIAGQGFTPYNDLGRKGSWRDYIPSLYVRFNRDGKWFVQSGFRYGAPQLENGRLYSAKTDTLSIQKYNTTSSYLKKTFYHQVPLTFNYFVSPKLSIGGGAVWNVFSSAVSSREIIQHDRFTGADTALSSGIIFNTRGADSNFVRSYFQATFEAQYKWKKFSFGANYSFGLQPYIKFILPGGTEQEEKNKALQIFIRYELWRSKN